jgi:hypothetical protein
MSTGENAGKVLSYIMDDVLAGSHGNQFTDEAMAILTLCLSELIKAGYCSHHYQDVLNIVNLQIRQDLK